MESTSTGLIHVAPGIQAEKGTIVFCGKEFTQAGAYISGDYAIGYLSKDSLSIVTWEGKPMGTVLRVVARWRTPRSYISSEMLQVEATIAGVVYTGRCAGESMLWRGKRKKGQ